MPLTNQTPTPLWACTDLPLWVRVALYATEHHRRDLAPGELHQALAPDAARSTISRAIRRGVDGGLLRRDSTARCLYSLSRAPR